MTCDSYSGACVTPVPSVSHVPQTAVDGRTVDILPQTGGVIVGDLILIGLILFLVGAFIVLLVKSRRA